MVECDLAKVEVAGSNPVSRSRFLCFQLARAPMTHQLGFGTLFARAGARYPSGKGEVCKTFMRRFDSDPRLHHFLRVFAVCGGRTKIVMSGAMLMVPRSLEATVAQN